MSIPGIAEKTAPTIFCYFGEPERFASTCKAQGFAGMFPETDATGLLDRKGTTLPRPDRLFSGATSSSPPITFVATTLTVRGCTTI